jgi:hypothetical protein
LLAVEAAALEVIMLLLAAVAVVAVLSHQLKV